MIDEQFIKQRNERLAERVRCSCAGSGEVCDRCWSALLDEIEHNPRISS